MKVLIDPHHTDLFRAFQFLFEKRFRMELYRPEGCEWYERGYYWHPIAEEALGNLTPHGQFDPGKHAGVFTGKNDGVLFKNHEQDGMVFRWLRLENVREIDLIVCTSDRNEDQFYRLRRDFGLKCPILRYTGNADESVNPDKFDIFIPAVLSHYEQYVHTGLKRGLLFHPEFDTELYRYSEPPDLAYGLAYSYGIDQSQLARAPAVPIIRNFLNFTYHHREPGSPWETWCRYENYVKEFGGKAILHGLGTPPPGIETELDVIIDICFDRMGRPDLKNRSKWPDLAFNRGEPANHTQISRLMALSNAAVHIKRSPPEGYGFVIHCLAACGRPPIIEYDAYRHLSARAFLQHRETCLYVTGHDTTDKENLRWALEPENNLRMSKTLYYRFKENVSFEAEAENIKSLL